MNLKFATFTQVSESQVQQLTVVEIKQPQEFLPDFNSLMCISRDIADADTNDVSKHLR